MELTNVFYYTSCYTSNNKNQFYKSSFTTMPEVKIMEFINKIYKMKN